MESTVGICGAGTMGRGISLTIASRGVPVILYDMNLDMLSSATSWIEKELTEAVEKKRIGTSEKINILDRIKYTNLIADCHASLFIEAVTEKTETKSTLFKELSKINPGETIFATNTSSLSITRIAEQTPFPEKIIGLHFFNPANRMKLVEIIKTKYVTEELMKWAQAFILRLGKIPVICSDSPGFIVNRVARPFYLEALRLAEMEIADIFQVDRLMESAGFRMGPFHLMDLIGHDINYTVSSSVYEALGRPARLEPSSMQKALVQKGALGKKTGKGFFQYDKQSNE